MELVDLANKLSGAGLATILILILITGWKQLWVFGAQLTRERFLLEQQRDQMTKERDEWRRMALQGSSITDKALDHASTVQKGIA